MNAPVRLSSVREEARAVLERLGVDPIRLEADGPATLQARSPITGEVLGTVRAFGREAADEAIARAAKGFATWRSAPAPRRGELVRLFGEELRAAKADLGRLVVLEAGKILSEGLGEVQEMIDICDYAVGLSRQLFGLTIASERPDHRMMETWHPLGPVGVISAFNFPVAVFCWNAALAWVAGDTVVWKPSEKTPLTALAVEALFKRAARRFGQTPEGLLEVLFGGREAGEALVDHPSVPLVSATGSTAMGRAVAPRLAARFARALLELGGNNAAIVCASADLDLTLRAVAFSAMGTAGQRCTSLRRLIVHRSAYDRLVPRLKAAFSSARVGDPRDPETLVGPLIDEAAADAMARALASAQAAGGRAHGGARLEGPGGAYVRPALVEIDAAAEIVRQETFAPILYVVSFDTLEEAIALQNGVPQGLASAIFTRDMGEMERFLSASGSDCGIANVNIGPSGAEIGGAFGGEKETGGGRESGSDSWRAYMRRATNTINYGDALALAQGVRFDVEAG